MCEKNPVGAKIKDGFTTTNDFNWRLERRTDKRDKIYSIMGKADAQPITAESCEAVDCMHPCYGKDQYGACSKCAG